MRSFSSISPSTAGGLTGLMITSRGPLEHSGQCPYPGPVQVQHSNPVSGPIAGLGAHQARQAKVPKG